MSKLKKKRQYAEFKKTVKNIKEMKIRGARSIARAALDAYSLFPTKQGKKMLIGARPTEPMLVNTLHKFEKLGKEKTVFSAK